MPWTVSIISLPKVNSFKAGFFPREFHYRRDALALQEEVKKEGGEASVDPSNDRWKKLKRIVKASPGISATEIIKQGCRVSLREAEALKIIEFREGGWYVTA